MVVKKTLIGKRYRVSTVNLKKESSGMMDYETAVFNHVDRELDCIASSTYKSAMLVHNNMIKKWKKIAQGK